MDTVSSSHTIFQHLKQNKQTTTTKWQTEEKEEEEKTGLPEKREGGHST